MLVFPTKNCLIHFWANLVENGDSYHLLNHRIDRSNKIRFQLPPGKELCRNVVDRGHPNGPEEFVLLDNGVIEVYNARTQKHITDLIARPGQIKSRMGQTFFKLPFRVQKSVLDKARENETLGRNNW